MSRLGIAALVSLIALSSPAQDLPPLVETMEVRVVNLDVVVTDRQGRRVTGLTQADFEVLDAKKPQVITNFSEIREAELPAEVIHAAPDTPAAAAPVQRNKSFIIFVDASSIDPRRRHNVFAELRRFASDTLKPGDRAMVAVWNRQLQIAQPFTDSPEALEAAIAQVEKMGVGVHAQTDRGIIHQRVLDERELALSGIITFAEAYRNSLGHARTYTDQRHGLVRSMLTSATASISSLRGTEDRKAFVFVSDYLPSRVGTDMYAFVAEVFRAHIQEADVASRFEAESIGKELEALVRTANASSTAIYMISAGGMAGMGEIDAATPDGPENTRAGDTALELDTRTSFTRVAGDTGGMAYLGGDAAKMMQRIADDFRSYYSIGFRPTDVKIGKERSVTVRVKKPGYSVRTRSSYSFRSVADDMADRVVANLYDPISGGELVVRVDPREPSQVGRREATVPVNVYVAGRNITLLPRDGSLAGEVTVFVCAGAAKKGASKVHRHTQRLNIPPADESRFRAGHLTFSFQLVIESRAENTISAGVLDTVSGTYGLARTAVRPDAATKK